MEVSLEHPKYYDDFIEKIKSLEEIEDCYYVTGDYDFMLKISTCSSKTLEYLHRTVKGIQEVHKQGITVLLVEQNAKMALSIADRAYVLETGHITMSGDAKELLNNEQVKKAYLGL